jgi:predicted NBD/HSP70 family sugar kinase
MGRRCRKITLPSILIPLDSVIGLIKLLSINQNEALCFGKDEKRECDAPASLGGNRVQIRRYHTLLVLRELRRLGSASKSDLARAIDLNNSSTSQIIRELEDDGLIEETGKRHDGMRGQPATLYRLRSDGAYAIGVRLDRARIETALIDFEGRILDHIAHEQLLPKPAAAFELVTGDIRSILSRNHSISPDKIAGIGLAQPYNLGAWLGELGLPAGSFSGWDDVNFSGMLSSALPFAIFSENDGTAAASAELLYGRGREERDFLYVFIGPAIGGGIVLGGETLRGRSGNAGDLAVIPVEASQLPSAPSPKSGRDILITRASLNGLARHAAFLGKPHADMEHLAALVRRGDAAYRDWLRDCVDALAPAIQSATAVLDIPVVIIDADLDDGFIDTLLAVLPQTLRRTAAEAREPPRLVRGSFGRMAGAIGVASLPFFHAYVPRANMLTRADGLQLNAMVQ